MPLYLRKVLILSTRTKQKTRLSSRLFSNKTLDSKQNSIRNKNLQICIESHLQIPTSIVDKNKNYQVTRHYWTQEFLKLQNETNQKLSTPLLENVATDLGLMESVNEFDDCDYTTRVLALMPLTLMQGVAIKGCIVY